MADRSHQLILDALQYAATHLAGAPLFRRKFELGLFPNSAAARDAVRQAVAAGWLRPVAGDDSPSNRHCVTADGMNHLLELTHPRAVLEECLRAVESRGQQLADVAANLTDLQKQWAGLKETIRCAVARYEHSRGEIAPAESTVMAILAEWETGRNAGDLPLPELFRQLKGPCPGITVGRFHDTLRALHDGAQVYLHPWTGPLYAIPEPAFGLLIGHEIAYYVSRRAAAVASKPRLVAAVA